jgi:hypothetical protein
VQNSGGCAYLSTEKKKKRKPKKRKKKAPKKSPSLKVQAIYDISSYGKAPKFVSVLLYMITYT